MRCTKERKTSCEINQENNAFMHIYFGPLQGTLVVLVHAVQWQPLSRIWLSCALFQPLPTYFCMIVDWWQVPLPDLLSLQFPPPLRSWAKIGFSASLSTISSLFLLFCNLHKRRRVEGRYIAEQPWVAVVESRRKTSMLTATMNQGRTEKRTINILSRSLLLVQWTEWAFTSLRPLCLVTPWCRSPKGSWCLLLCTITMRGPTRTWPSRKASDFKSWTTLTPTGGWQDLWLPTRRATSLAIMLLLNWVLTPRSK